MSDASCHYSKKLKESLLIYLMFVLLLLNEERHFAVITVNCCKKVFLRFLLISKDFLNTVARVKVN